MYRDEFYDYVELSANQIIRGFIVEALACIGLIAVVAFLFFSLGRL